MATAAEPYTFQQQPQPVANVATEQKSKYRDPYATQSSAENQQTKVYANVMWDRRVYRGNTYAAQVVPLSAQAEAEMRKRQEKMEKQRRMRDQKKQEMEALATHKDDTPMPVMGRKHIEIQTEQYLEEIIDPVLESDANVQTDQFMDRPDTPEFIPAKSGIDAETQIEDDLFDFDFEVEPLLEVIVGKTLEQSMLEVMEEEEMERIRLAKEDFKNKRNAELNVAQRMEQEEKRRFEEKERRKEQERLRLQQEQQVKQKLACRAFSQSFLANLENKVFTTLEKEGYFYDVVEREVETQFLPKLAEMVQIQLEKKRARKRDADDLIKRALIKMLQHQQQ